MNGSASPIGRFFAARSLIVNPAKYPDETFELYSIPAFDRGRPEVAAGCAIGSAKQLVNPGDVLLSRIVPHIRRSWIVGETSGGRRALASTEWIVFRSDHVDPGYLHFVLVSDSFHRQFMATVGGVGGSLARAQRDQVAQISVEMPPLAEQHQTAEILGLVKTAVASELEVAELATALKEATRRFLFTRGLRGESTKETEVGEIPESWILSSVGDHFRLASGGTPARNDPRCWEGGEIPWVKSTEVGRGAIARTGECITAFGLANSGAKLLAAGTLLVAMYGETRGKVGSLAIDAACNQACAALVPSADTLDASYLRYWLEFRYEDTRQRAHGGAQQNLNLEIIRALPVALPARRDEQNEIVGILQSLDDKVELHREKIALLEVLFNALLTGLVTGTVRISDLDLSALDGREWRV